MVNFYRRFVPRAAELQAPLNELLAGPKKKGSQNITLTTEQLVAFQECKSGLAQAALLAHPDVNAELAIHADASDKAIGAVLQQRQGDAWQPLAYFSKKLSPPQTKYSPYDRELLAIYKAVRYFRHMVEARIFTIFTDHKPLTFAFSTRRDNCTPRQFRYLDYISQFSVDIRYIPGKSNVVADSLSRIEELSSNSLDYQALAQDQVTDEELQDLLQNGTSLRLEQVKGPDSHVSVYCDTTTLQPRPFLTQKYRRQAFEALHNLSHPGAKASVRLITQRFVWPGIKKDCRQWVQECLQCQRAKIHRHTKAPLQTFSIPTTRFRHVHIDIVGPLPLSSGYRYCLTAIDRFTRWPEAYPLQDITAEACATAFVSGWVARFGCPELITTDRGRQFESSLFKAMAVLIGATHHTTTAYHPEANGLVERLHRQLKAAITCHTNTRWTEALPLVLLGIRSAWKEDLQTSAAELVYGEPLRLPGQFFSTTPPAPVDYENFISRLRELITKLTPHPTSWHTARTFYIPKDLATCTHVFLRQGPAHRPLQVAYLGPYKVIRRGKKSYDIDVQGKIATVSINRLKPAYMTRNDPPAPVADNTPVPTTEGDTNKTPAKKTRSGRVVRFPEYYRS